MVKTSGCALSARCKPYTNSPETQIDKPKQLGEVFPTSSRQLVVNSTPWHTSTGLATGLGHGLQPVAYYSKKLTGAPCNYATHERELLAIVIAVKKWRPYLDGKCTRIVTDHRPLTHLHT